MTYRTISGTKIDFGLLTIARDGDVGMATSGLDVAPITVQPKDRRAIADEMVRRWSQWGGAFTYAPDPGWRS